MAGKKDSKVKATGKKAAVPRVQRTAELAAKVCAVIASGGTVGDAADKLGVSQTFIYAWRRDDANFAQDFTRAREDGAQFIEDMLIEVMRQENARVGNPDTTAQDVSLLQHVWEQGYKLLQVYNARFRERKAVELTGAEGKDLIPPANDELLREALAASREKLAAMERERREREDGTGS